MNEALWARSFDPLGEKKWQSGDVQSSGHEWTDRAARRENLLASVPVVSWDGSVWFQPAQAGM